MNRIVQTCLATGWGGLEMVICDFHAWLVRQNISSTVVCLKNSPLEKNMIERGFGADLKVIMPSWNKYYMAGTELKKLDSAKTVFLFHRQQGPKALALRDYKARVSVICHTFFDVEKKDLLHRHVFSKVDQWVVLTASQKLNLLQTISVNPAKISIIPNGVDLEMFNPPVGEKTKKDHVDIGIIARLDPQKGQDVAIEALDILNSEVSRQDVRLHLFGEDTVDGKSFRPVLEKAIREKNLQEQVVFHGFSRKLSEDLPALDFVWMPSQRETFGRCILEAMACKVPVIASAAGGVPDIITHGKNGLLFKPNSAPGLAMQTLRLLQDPSLVKQLAENAFQDVAIKYDSEMIWKKLLQTVQGVHLEAFEQTVSVL